MFLDDLPITNEKDDLPDAKPILCLFEEFDPKGFEKYIQNKLNDNLQVLKYLQTFASKVFVSNGSISWSYEKDYNKFLTEDQINNAYAECLKNGQVWALPDEMQLKIIAFDLWTRGQRDWVGQVPNELVIKRRDELKKIVSDGNKSFTLYLPATQ